MSLLLELETRLQFAKSRDCDLREGPSLALIFRARFKRKDAFHDPGQRVESGRRLARLSFKPGDPRFDGFQPDDLLTLARASLEKVRLQSPLSTGSEQGRDGRGS